MTVIAKYENQFVHVGTTCNVLAKTIKVSGMFGTSSEAHTKIQNMLNENIQIELSYIVAVAEEILQDEANDVSLDTTIAEEISDIKHLTDILHNYQLFEFTQIE